MTWKKGRDENIDNTMLNNKKNIMNCPNHFTANFALSLWSRRPEGRGHSPSELSPAVRAGIWRGECSKTEQKEKPYSLSRGVEKKTACPLLCLPLFCCSNRASSLATLCMDQSDSFLCTFLP
ncbi:uncharacterized protein MONOS_18538 [Monocercomonoides exilis]|uniref:uncharacterized protein n=1 Tax=Monocercomonoides exilis TaxID=2049356 RepID=UPI00355A8362|nr:hypothetical protein MONOS_18538 [Monocercomonoides exilis]